MAVWGLGDTALEEDGSYEVWGILRSVGRGGWTSKLGRDVHGCCL